MRCFFCSLWIRWGWMRLWISVKQAIDYVICHTRVHIAPATRGITVLMSAESTPSVNIARCLLNLVVTLPADPVPSHRCLSNAGWIPVLTFFPLCYLILIFTYLKLCPATVTHNFNWVKITHICLILDKKLANCFVWTLISFPITLI